jgi:hypothetical protein
MSRSKFIFQAPFNSLSFGQVSYNLLKELYKDGREISLFPVGNSFDLDAYGEIKPDFQNYIKQSFLGRFSGIKKDTPSLSLWHLMGSEMRLSDVSYLYTFHEILGVTPVEKTICSLKNKVIFSSSFSCDLFGENGINNVDFCPVGFDEEILDAPEYNIGEVIHFGLIGKFENRKNTALILKTWAEQFGNKKEYRLTCLVDNPFFEKGQLEKVIGQVLNNKFYTNITFLPRLKFNAEVNALYRAIDIDLSGLSSAEGWNLPSFNSTALGKWSCVSNCTAHKDWATQENCILVEPNGTKEPYDNAFFAKGQDFNQGLIYNISKESIIEAMDKAVLKAKIINVKGLELRETFSYKNIAQNLLNKCDL